MPLDEASLAGLLRLLDEPDQQVVDPLIDRLARLPAPERAQVLQRARAAGPLIQRNANALEQRVVFVELGPGWAALAARREPVLEDAVNYIARTDNAAAADGIKARLDELARAAGHQLSGDRAFDNGLEVLTRVLTSAGLRGNTQDYYRPANSYLHRVLETGLGIPISLCSVAILVGMRLELPVHGIGAPGHFLGFYGDPAIGRGTYFDPFDGFKRLTQGQVMALSGQFVQAPLDPAHFRPATTREIIARTLHNLVNSHAACGEPDRARNLDRWRSMMSG